VLNAALAIVLLTTIAALYVRPFGARDWHVALAGGLTAWLIGPLGLRGGLSAIGESGNIVAFFLGLMLIAAGAEAAGLYARAALLLRSQRSARGRLLVVLVAGSFITAILSNDATPLVLTPAIFAAGIAGSRTTTNAAFATAFTANGASLLLPVSNPVNLLFLDRFEMGFDTYLATITPAALAGLIALGLVSWRRAPAGGVDEPIRELPIVARRPAPALFVIAILAVLYIWAGLSEVPLGIVTLAGGVGLYVAARLGGPVDAAAYRKHIAPGILVFVASLLLLVESVAEAGLLDGLADLLLDLESQPALVAILGAALVATVLSNLMNNWPAALLIAATIATTPGAHPELVAGALIGCALGANFTMVGSLSTVFWLSLARQHGANYTAASFARLAFAPTLASVLAACLVAALLV